VIILKDVCGFKWKYTIISIRSGQKLSGTLFYLLLYVHLDFWRLHELPTLHAVHVQCTSEATGTQYNLNPVTVA